MSVPILSNGNALSEETHRLIRGILQREGIRPELRPQTESIVLHWLRSAVRESEELRKAEIMDEGVKLAAKYHDLVHREPWRDQDIERTDRALQKLVDALHALPNGPGYRPDGGTAS